ncbi:MAG TPA: MAPEG family protein [Allosphingosinicella sp.]|jgi:uncharacterized MAPEG superfamily protein
MTIELAILAWGCVLALLHVLLTAQVRTRQYGAKWNMGARDEELPPPRPVVGRLERAQANFYETFPLFAAAAIIVSVAHLGTRGTAHGAILWIAARIVYLPLYAFGIRYLRTCVWTASLVGIALVIWPALAATFG